MDEPLLVAWADARPHVGLGHVVRSFALAQAWADRGGRSMLCLSEVTGPVRALATDATVELHELGSSCDPFDVAGGAALGDHAARLGASWVSIDSYATTAAAQEAVRSRGARVLVIDDHETASPYDCDLHLDQNLGARPAPAASGAQHAIAGSPFALLRRSFGALPDGCDRSRVVISLGGNPTPAVAALGSRVAASLAERAQVDLVLGAATLVGDQPERPNVQVHHAHPEPWRLFAGAAVALSAAGTTAWELCASGTASVLVALADNQEPLGDAIARAGAGVYLGRADDLDAPTIVRTIEGLLDAPDDRAELARRAVALVDGCGAARVTAQMRSLGLHARPATHDDIGRYFTWANDPLVRAMSFNVAPIAWEDHVGWFCDRLERDGCWMYVIEDGAHVPLGQVRFDAVQDSREVMVGISLDAAARGRGLGAPLIIAGVRALTSETSIRKVHAEVRVTNTASAQSFRVAGFTHRSHASGADGEIDTFAYECAASSARSAVR